MAQLTHLLGKAQDGDRNAWNLVYHFAGPRLRSIASGILAKERRGHLLQTTALIGESWLRLSRCRLPFQSGAHFFHLSARAMTQVLVDAARRNSHKVQRSSVDMEAWLSQMREPGADPQRTAEVRLVLDKLEQLDPEVADTLWLRFAMGLTIPETAFQQGRPEWRVREDGEFGLTWMARQLR
jgi:RNA polymerase sigma factor (TIGR02999 family)